MAKFTIDRWRCDGCGAEADRWLKPSSAYEIRVSVDHGTAGGNLINWGELCVSCNAIVAQAVRDLERAVDLAREERGDSAP